MLNLNNVRTTLVLELAKGKDLPCHVSAFCAWMISDNDALRQCIDEALALKGQMFHPDHVAALGYGAASGLLTDEEYDILRDETIRLGGRTFFSPGRPPRFEIDGIALLGVALGITNDKNDSDRQWLRDLLATSASRVTDDPWQFGLVTTARLMIGEAGLHVTPADLAVAMSAKGIGACSANDLTEGWGIAARLEAHNSGPARDAVRLAAFDHALARQAQISIAATSRDDLIALLQNVGRSMRLWTYESEKRTPKSAIAKWEIENEYHVQNLLWAVLAPVFADLEDEENLPSIGHKNPRADLGIPSLRTIIEVKFLRRSGQSAWAKITEEVAADASLYLSKPSAYDNIIAFVWDDCAETEQHHELKSGLEAIKGVSAAIILPRPSKMKRLGDNQGESK